MVSSKIITEFPYSAIKLIKEQSEIVCRSFDKAHKYNVDIEAFGSESAVIMNLNNRDIIFYNQDELPQRIKFSLLHEFGHRINEHEFKVTSEEIYGIEEVETNYFSAQLLMPEQILREIQSKGIRITKELLIKFFGVSNEAAEKRISTLNRTLKLAENERLFDDIIVNKYKDWLNSKIPSKNFMDMFLDDYDRQKERETWLY